jgi:2-desacetyl-2-hydroxyethyl bacteriochlorophyllide A dehydrogenase
MLLEQLEPSGINLRAVLKTKPGVGFEYREDVEKPKINADQVLVKVMATGICSGDINLYLSGAYVGQAAGYPFIPGHEFAGQITEVGSNVKHLEVGSRVTAEIMVTCGHCDYCNMGERIYCTSVRELGAEINGSYAEYIAVPAQNIHVLPDQVRWEDAALSDCLASALHPFEKLSWEILKNIVILGAGPIGLCATQIAKTLGAKMVISIDTLPARLELAKQLGADQTINADQVEAVKSVQKLTNGLGADAVIEMTGSPVAVANSIEMVRKNGEIVWMGHVAESVALKEFLVMSRGIHIHGCFNSTWLTYERALHLMASGRVKMRPFVSHELPLSEVSKAFDLLMKKQAMKVLMKP